MLDKTEHRVISCTTVQAPDVIDVREAGALTPPEPIIFAPVTA